MSDEVNTEVQAEIPVTPPVPEKKVELTEEDKSKFFKAFLNDEPFIDTVKLFDGKMKIVLRTLTLEENDQVFKQINFDQEKGIARSDDSYFVKIVEYRLASSIVEVNGVAFCPEVTMESFPANAKEGTTYIMERLKVMQQWSTFKLGAITEKFNRFEEKVKALTEECVKGNF